MKLIDMRVGFCFLLLAAASCAACSASDHTLIDVPLGAALPAGSNTDSDAALDDLELRSGAPDMPNVDCGEVTATDAGQLTLSRLPYVQRMTASSTSILYKVQQAEDSWLEVAAADGTSQLWRPAVDPQAPDGLQRVAEIAGLEPATEYCYSVLGLTEPTRFRTAPAPGTDARVRFAVFGDSGSGDENQLRVRDQLASLQLDLMLHTGDVAYASGTLEQLEHNYFDVYARLIGSVPMFPSAGNHDYETEEAAPFREVFDLPDSGISDGAERWYSFDWGDVHFVALDTQRIEEEQIAWLDRDLAARERPWTVVYMHRPPLSSGHHGGNDAVLASFVPLFEHHGVQLVFAGHEHDYERTIPIEGVTYVVTGGAGRYLREVGTSWFTAHSASVFHFVHVELQAGELVLRAIDSDGLEIDSVTLSL